MHVTQKKSPDHFGPGLNPHILEEGGGDEFMIAVRMLHRNILYRVFT